MKKLITEIKPVLLPLQFILSLVLFICCLREVFCNESVLLKELFKSVAVVSTLVMLAAISNNSNLKNNDTNDNY